MGTRHAPLEDLCRSCIAHPARAAPDAVSLDGVHCRRARGAVHWAPGVPGPARPTRALPIPPRAGAGVEAFGVAGGAPHPPAGERIGCETGPESDAVG